MKHADYNQLQEKIKKLEDEILRLESEMSRSRLIISQVLSTKDTRIGRLIFLTIRLRC
jgi:hypothetical protein